MSQQSTSEVACPACRGGNPPQARNCMWCGALLAANFAPPPVPIVQPLPAKRGVPGWLWVILITVLGVILLATFGRYFGLSRNSPSVSSSRPPDYVKEVVAYKEGTRAFAIYFILADANGVETSAAGKTTLEITSGSDRLLSFDIDVEESDFTRAKLGRGAFEHEGLICSFGRIAYSRFSKQPTTSTGKVRVKFQLANGRVLEGEDTVFFDR